MRTVQSLILNSIESQIRSARYDEQLAPPWSSIPGKDLGEITLNQFDKAKRKVGSLYGKGEGKKEPFLIDMMKSMENSLVKATENNAVLKGAREANRRFSKAKLLDKEVRKLQNQRKVSGSGGNVTNSYRRAIQKILDNPKQIDFFDEPEIRAMQQIVDGRVADNILRLAGKMAPSGNGLIAYIFFSSILPVVSKPLNFGFCLDSLKCALIASIILKPMLCLVFV